MALLRHHAARRPSTPASEERDSLQLQQMRLPWLLSLIALAG